jgi:hypothetical protein
MSSSSAVVINLPPPSQAPAYRESLSRLAEFVVQDFGSSVTVEPQEGAGATRQLGHQQFLTFLVHDLIADKIEFVDGAMPVPTGPGLGIELDRDALEFYGDIYKQYGEFEGYGPITPESPLPPDLPVPNR